MRFMMIVKANPDSEAGKLPTREVVEAMGRYNDELVKAGVMLAGEGLHPSSKGFRVRFSGAAKPRVIDGPFTESKELIAGYAIIQAKSREEAIEWTKRFVTVDAPGRYRQESECEIRQMFELTDFPANAAERHDAARR